MAYVEVNTIFDELKKCLNTLIEFKTFVDLISHKFRYELDSNELQKYLDINERVDTSLKRITRASDQFTDEDNDPQPEVEFEERSEDITNQLVGYSREAVELKHELDCNGLPEEADEESSGQWPTTDHFPPSIDLKIVHCDFEGCDKQFTTKYRMNAHRKTHQEGKRFACQWPECDRAFRNKSTLNIHAKEHSGNGLYRCHWIGCERTFKQREQLKYHVNNHTGQRPYLCQWPGCQSAFANKNALGVHFKRHQGYTYSCDYDNCYYKTSDSVHMKSHKKKHHNEDG